MSLNYYHVIDLPDGTYTPGVNDQRDQPAYLGLADVDLSGKRTLDVAALDGFWAFWSENRGAEHVLAIDVDKYENYDWGIEGPPDTVSELAHQDKASVFWHLKEKMNSKVERKTKSIYELDEKSDGSFDLMVVS